MSDYSPSPQVAAALTAFEEALEAVEECRRKLREAVAADLKASPDATNDVVAAHLPWSAETVRGIAREYGVPPKRKPTVRSIKPKKKPGGPSAG